MSAQFHRLNVASIRRLTSDAVMVTFAIPEHLKEQFAYKPGQYITLKTEIEGKEVRRAYSLCSSPYTDDLPSVGVKKVEGGLMSTFINSLLAEGAAVDVMPPMGNFTTPIHSSHSRLYALFGGGSGITPLLSLIKSILTQEPQSTVQLFYANRDEASIMFKSDLDELARTYGERLVIRHVLETPSSTLSALEGRISKERAASLIEEHFAEQKKRVLYFLCGPAPMMDQIQAAFESLSIPKDNIHREFFTAPLSDKSEGSSTATDEAPRARTVKATLFGEDITVEVQPDESILEALIRADYDPPYACQIGACCTCRALTLSGKVVMDEREALSDSEIEEGYILTCQSHPITDDVVIDYDQ